MGGPIGKELQGLLWVAARGSNAGPMSFPFAWSPPRFVWSPPQSDGQGPGGVGDAAEGVWEGFLDKLQASPGLVAMLLVAILLWATVVVMFRKSLASKEQGRLARQWLMVFGVVAAALFLLLISPIDQDTKAQIVEVLGVVLPAAIALSSTAILGNAVGGLILYQTANFKLGDFISVGDHFGRVSERTLMHTEIQTADRDLITLPNLALVTQPVKVVRPSGSVVSATVSLGYEVPWSKVEAALKEAAKRAKLEEPFAQVMELGDYSVVYRAAGLLSDVRSLLSVRSKLRTHMLDCLHEADIEILSPQYITMRAVARDAPSVAPEGKKGGDLGMTDAPTDLIFDKADKAQSLIAKRAELAELESGMQEVKGDERKALELRYERIKKHVAYLERVIEEEDGS